MTEQTTTNRWQRHSRQALSAYVTVTPSPRHVRARGAEVGRETSKRRESSTRAKELHGAAAGGAGRGRPKGGHGTRRGAQRGYQARSNRARGMRPATGGAGRNRPKGGHGTRRGAQRGYQSPRNTGAYCHCPYTPARRPMARRSQQRWPRPPRGRHRPAVRRVKRGSQQPGRVGTYCHCPGRTQPARQPAAQPAPFRAAPEAEAWGQLARAPADGVWLRTPAPPQCF